MPLYDYYHYRFPYLTLRNIIRPTTFFSPFSLNQLLFETVCYWLRSAYFCAVYCLWSSAVFFPKIVIKNKYAPTVTRICIPVWEEGRHLADHITWKLTVSWTKLFFLVFIYASLFACWNRPSQVATDDFRLESVRQFSTNILSNSVRSKVDQRQWLLPSARLHHIRS